MDKESITFSAPNMVSFHLGDNGKVSVPFESILLVGEFTTEDGPYAEDHLLSVWSSDGRVFEIPIWSPGVKQLLEMLSAKTKAAIETSLATSSSFASRVLYPPEKSGQELFVFRSTRKGLGGLLYPNVMERRLVPDLAILVEGGKK
jgi:hypothetical protein